MTETEKLHMTIISQRKTIRGLNKKLAEKDAEIERVCEILRGMQKLMRGEPNE